jgi:4-amino-4-deoxy-L-arabinose transferase-like glycosyltransferase
MAAVATQARRVQARVWTAADSRWVGWTCAAAFLLRLVFVLLVERKDFALSDPFYYHSIAVNLAEGNGFDGPTGVPTAEWPPLFPFLLSFVYRVFGHDPVGGEVFNVFLGTATVGLLYLVALRVLGRREARFCAVFLAVLPGQIFFCDVLLSETLSTFVLVAFVALMIVLPMRPWAFVVLGLVIGLATLTRGEGPLMLVIPLAVWWGRVPTRELVRRTVILVLAMLVVVVPWTIRNASELHAFIPVANNSGPTFWSGHNPDADGGATYPGRELNLRVAKYPEPEREVKFAALLRSEGIDYAVHHPTRELVLIPLRFLSLLRGDSQIIPIWVNTGSSPPITRAGILRLGVLADVAFYGLLTLFTLALLVYGRRLLVNAALRGILVYFAASLVLYCVVLYGNFRYRVPLEPLMLLVAAPLVVRIWRLRDQVTPRRAADAATQ